jgi:hypothetical protein
MHNYSGQQIGQLTQRTVDPSIEQLSAGVVCDRGRQTSRKPTQGLSPVALREELISLARSKGGVWLLVVDTPIEVGSRGDED